MSRPKYYTDCHKVWHQFERFLIRNYGKDLFGEWKYLDPKNKKIKYRDFDENKLNSRLVGHEVIKKIESYCKRYLPEIEIINCDDSVYAGSIILLIPHHLHGITIMFIPQCTNIQNQFFLYKGHYVALMKKLSKMKSVYGE